ncbi:unnamed protein product [Penicillium camemberti]|uniref:Str. FM013 n=1 Tax=Penicillium camemberti (strain FM 013) TaxID=1429867 RepID=A0A0G4PUZ1_PENC3|nr:unnamed protein product [Penicillium camemberti]
MHEICKDLSPSSQCDLSTDQQGHPRYPSSCSPELKDFSNRSPLPSYSKNTSAAHVRS